MECKKCGAELEQGAQVCPECGEPVASPDAPETTETNADESQDLKPTEPDAAEPSVEPAAETDETASSAAAEAPVEEGELAESAGVEGEPEAVAGEPSDDAAAEAQAASEPEASGLKPGVIALIAAAVVLVLVGGFFAYNAFFGGNDPAGVTVRFMNAYANYDGKGMLQYATHASMTASDVVQFQQQADQAKKTNKGKPFLKDIKIGKVTVDPKDPNTATVRFSASFLNTQDGKYTAQTESVTVLKQNGKWLVKLFQ